MEEQLISFKTAKLAKEKRFDGETYRYYNHHRLVDVDYHDNNLYNWNNSLNKNYISCPTQSLIQRWLREEHNIDIIVKPLTGDIKDTKSYTSDIFKFGTSDYIKLLEKILMKNH